MPHGRDGDALRGGHHHHTDTFKKFRYPIAGQTSHHADARRGRHAHRQRPSSSTRTGLRTITSRTSAGTRTTPIQIVLARTVETTSKCYRLTVSTGRAVRAFSKDRTRSGWARTSPHLPENSPEFIHWSQRDGWWHLYLYDSGKGMIKAVDQGSVGGEGHPRPRCHEAFSCLRHSGLIGQKDQRCYGNAALQRRAGHGEYRAIDTAPGTHNGQLSSDGKVHHRSVEQR
ncbi:MAG: DPP IV N-terminal domain-containing protein [Flavobacteriales bacterium]|nr:DPP IV N-terminal domain-containing protein [Flavobacteriales bacterium]